jgi:ferredoxin
MNDQENISLQFSDISPLTKANRLQRDIIEIDQSLCDGCGQCVTGCAERALAIIDGKAKLVSEVYCDGLGACLGQCPQGALKIVKRFSEDYDHQAVLERLKGPDSNSCPGVKAMSLGTADVEEPASCRQETQQMPNSTPLASWPIQLALVSPKAQIFTGRTIIVAADCVAFASADFHRLFLGKRDVLVMGCPKLDDASLYIAKLGVILRDNLNIQEVLLPIMHVPCCQGLWSLAKQALQRSNRTDVALKGWVFSNEGRILESAKPLN